MKSRRSLLKLLSILFLASACTSVGPPVVEPTAAPGDNTAPFARLEFLAALEPESALADDRLGGLSGIAWDQDAGLLLAISDDRGDYGPVRFYEFDLELPAANDPGSWRARRSLPLLGGDGGPIGRGYSDTEGIALLDKDLIISSEGTDRGPPFLGRFDRDGRHLADLALPIYLFPDGTRGVRPNLGLEAVTALPSGTVFAGLENALVQDGPEAGVDTPSPARLLRWDGRGQRSEFVYQTDPVAQSPDSPDDFHTNGLVALLALDEWQLLALERSYTAGLGNDIRLYLLDLSLATDVAGISARPPDARPAGKRLVASLSRMGLALDNLEGMSWGPELADGRRSLLFVSDDNFSSEQTTHLLVFAVSDAVADVGEIQGAGHRSPLDGAWLFGVEGAVTHVRPSEDGPSTAWIQTEDDGDPATSQGLRVIYESGVADLQPGDRVRLDGRLVESGRSGELSVTTLFADQVETTGSAELPPPVVLDPSAASADALTRPFPRLPLDDDGMATFDPSASSMDLLESLEGMRITIPAPTAVSGTSSFGEIALWPDGAEGVRSGAGGVVLTPDSFNPQRLIAVGGPDQPSPDLRVGDRFAEPITGVLDYAFGNYRLVVEEWPQPKKSNRARPGISWTALENDFTFATYNVLNLDPDDGDQFQAVAESIVAGLGSPDVLALQEIQDDNGPDDDGVTSADRTLTMLIDAIRAAGGPEYGYSQIDPIHDGEGGQPVGNIRVAYLYRGDRVELVARGAGDSWTSIEVADDGSFSLSPGRVAVDHPAFAGDEARGWEANRRCLAAEFLYQETTWRFVNCHLKSKRGDDRLFGDQQPPIFNTEEQRSAQAEVLASLAARVLTADPDSRLVVLGDTNEHEFRRPLRILTSGELTNLIEAVPQAERYTYNFNGNSQVLDNVLVSPAVMACDPEVAIVHWNIDLADSERASDHDPVLVRVPTECGASDGSDG